MFELTVTFDNGPEPSVTPEVLDVLARHRVASTFFVIGNKLQNPLARTCAERAQSEGHWIGNHTWTHSRPLGEQPGEQAAQLEIGRTQAEIGSLSQYPPLFRPTGGGGNLDCRLLSPEAAAMLQAGGFSCVLWNAVPRDWENPDRWVDIALAQLALQPWTLMVLHDLPTGAMRHLDRFLTEVAHRGGQFRQEFPPGCLPITAGSITGPLADFVSPASKDQPSRSVATNKRGGNVAASEALSSPLRGGGPQMPADMILEP
jgi:peptidoglycan/xylan/chitin deacetylase (PgdA/CDA1 family)